MTRLRKRWMLHSVDTFASLTVACSRAPISAQDTVYASASRDEQIADSSTMPPRRGLHERASPQSCPSDMKEGCEGASWLVQPLRYHRGRSKRTIAGFSSSHLRVGRKQLDRGREGHFKAYLAFTLLLLQEESYLIDFRSARLLPISTSCLWQWKASIGISGHREEE